MGFSNGGNPQQFQYAVAPASQVAAAGVATGNFTISLLLGPAGAGGQNFSLSDHAGGGTFAPGTLVTIPAGSTSVTFTYTNAAAGNYTLTVTPSGGALAGVGSEDVQASFTTGSTVPDGFLVTPATRSAVVNQLTDDYFIDLLAGANPGVAGGGGQAFTLTTSDPGGQFVVGGTVVATVTVPAGASAVAFQFRSANKGTTVLTVTASGAPYSVNVKTAQAVIGGAMANQALLPGQDMTWSVGYLRVGNTNFGKMQKATFKDAMTTKKGFGPEALAPAAAGIDAESVTMDCETLAINRKVLLQLRGGSEVAIAAIVDPVTAPTLTAATGVSNFTNGFVPVAYSYVNRYGETKISTVQAVTVTGATQKITVTSLGALPAGVTSVNLYVGAQSYASSPLALAAPLYLAMNYAGAAQDIVAYGLATAARPPASSSLGVAQTSWQKGTNDEPTLFDIVLLSNADGSGPKMIGRNCFSPDIEIAIGLREFNSHKATFDVWGDTTNGVWWEYVSA
jgi:hypothetical protein